MQTILAGIKVEKIACVIPKNNPTVFEYADGLVTEKEAKRLAKGTGFSSLRISDFTTTTSDLCFTAAKKCIETVKDKIDGLIFVTQTPDYYLPATSHALQARLGLPSNTICFDVNQGCAGYVYGLYLAALLVSTKQCKNVLLLAGDTISKLTSETDRATRCIFGDAGTATVISEGDSQIAFQFNSFGDRSNAIVVPNSRHRKDSKEASCGHLYLDGGAVMNFTLDDVPVCIEELLEFAKLKRSEIDLYACHQANKLILTTLAEKIGVSQDKLPFTAGEIGNTSSASIPLVLSAYNNSKKSVLCCGFGVGLTIGSCIADFSQTEFLGVEEI